MTIETDISTKRHHVGDEIKKHLSNQAYDEYNALVAWWVEKNNKHLNQLTYSCEIATKDMFKLLYKLVKRIQSSMKSTILKLQNYKLIDPELVTDFTIKIEKSYDELYSQVQLFDCLKSRGAYCGKVTIELMLKAKAHFDIYSSYCFVEKSSNTVAN